MEAGSATDIMQTYRHLPIDKILTEDKFGRSSEVLRMLSIQQCDVSLRGTDGKKW